MTNRFCTVSAAVFALLFVTVPARAATIEVVNLHFNGGDQLTGNIDFSPYIPGFGGGTPPAGYYYTDFFISGEPNLTFNGTSITLFDYALPPTNPAQTFLIPVYDFLNINTSNISNLAFAELIET
jgi:hypothetical protein